MPQAQGERGKSNGHRWTWKGLPSSRRRQDSSLSSNKLSPDSGRASESDDTFVTLNCGTEEELCITGYRLVLWRKYIAVLLSVLTCGLLGLVLYWRQDWWVAMTHKKCKLSSAGRVWLKDTYKVTFLADVKTLTSHGDRVLQTFGRRRRCSFRKKSNNTRSTLEEESRLILHNHENGSSSNYCRFFSNKRLKYIWRGDMGTFEKLKSFDTNSESTILASPGYSSYEAAKLRVLYGMNTIEVRVTGVFKLFVTQILNPFYVFQLFSCILWYTDHYEVFTTCILVLTIGAIGITIYTTRKMERALRDIITAATTVKVKRDGEFVSLRSEMLVPGDVLLIEGGSTPVLCDAVLTSGACVVNESMLTGEAMPITKTALQGHAKESDTVADKDFLKRNKQHVIYCGTEILQARGDNVQAVVLRTGFFTAKGELVRSIMFPKPLDFRLYRDTYKFIGFLAGLAFLGMIYSTTLMVARSLPAGYIIRRTLDLITLTVPPILPAALSVGIIIAQRRLKSEGVYCMQPKMINMAGSSNVFCFDKTGTLTEKGFTLRNVVENYKGMLVTVANDGDLTALVARCMATCHSLSWVDGVLRGDTLDTVMFERTEWTLDGGDKSLSVTSPDKSISLSITHQNPFSSALQRMSVVTRNNQTGQLVSFVKGSPEIIAKLSVKSSLPNGLSSEVSHLGSCGYRLIAMASKVIESDADASNRADTESELEFLGLMILSNPLKKTSRPALQELREANIRAIMVTGDNLETALSIAKECGIVGETENCGVVRVMEKRQLGDVTVEYEFDKPETAKVSNSESCKRYAMDGETWTRLREASHSSLPLMLKRGAVFARMTPLNKAQLVQGLQELGYYVGMCGDGANDCSALKAANTGISLSEAEASIAAPFTSKVPDIRCVPRLLKECRAALVTTFGLFKFISCYALIQFISVMTLYWSTLTLTDWEFFYVDFLLLTTLAVTFGLAPAYEKLCKSPPPHKLLSLSTVLSIIINVLIFAGGQGFIYVLVQQQEWFVPFGQTHNTTESYMSYENTAVFEVSSFQYLTAAIIFSRGPPYRQHIYRNYWFVANWIVALAITTLIVVYPAEFVVAVLELRVPPLDFRGYTVATGVVCFLVSYGFTLWMDKVCEFQQNNKHKRLRWFGRDRYSKGDSGQGVSSV